MEKSLWNPEELKKEHLQYFKKYLNNFSKDSREYKFLKRGIDELERSI